MVKLVVKWLWSLTVKLTQLSWVRAQMRTASVNVSRHMPVAACFTCQFYKVFQAFFPQ